MNTCTTSYGMQYRSMHTAVNRATNFSDRQTVRGIEWHLMKHEMFLFEPVEGWLPDVEISLTQSLAMCRDSEIVFIYDGQVTPDAFGDA